MFSKLTVTSRVESREVSIFLLDFKEFSDLSDDCDLVLILRASFSVNDGCDKLPVDITLCDLVILGVGFLSNSVFFGIFIASFLSKSPSLVCDLVTIRDILHKTLDLGDELSHFFMAESPDTSAFLVIFFPLETSVNSDLSVDGFVSLSSLLSPWDSFVADLVILLCGIMSGNVFSISEADLVSSENTDGLLSIVSCDEFEILALRHSLVFLIPFDVLRGLLGFLCDILGFFFEPGLRINLFNICLPFSIFSSSSFFCIILSYY